MRTLNTVGLRLYCAKQFLFDLGHSIGNANSLKMKAIHASFYSVEQHLSLIQMSVK